MMTKNTVETLSDSSALYASKSTQEHRSGKKDNAAAEAGFDLFLNSATSAANATTPTRSSASSRHTEHNTDHNMCETASQSDSVPSTYRTTENSEETAESQKAEDPGEVPPPKHEADTRDDALLAAAPAFPTDESSLLVQAGAQNTPQISQSTTIASEKQNDALLAVDLAFPTDESSLLLQAGTQNTPQITQSTTGLSEKQNSGDSAAALSSKQEAIAGANTLQDVKTLLSPEELSAALSQVEDNPGEKKASPATFSTTFMPGNNESTSPDPKLHQTSDARTQGPLNNLISSIKEPNLSGTLTNEQFSLSIDNGDKQDVSSPLTNNAAMQEKADFAGMTSREAALLQQTAPSTKSTPSAGEIHSENALSAMRSAPTPDLNDHKAHLVAAGNRLAVALEPEGLGKLNINLSLDRGTVNAQIQVSDPAARTLLENNMQQILDTLMHEGLTVGGFSVSLRHGAAGNGTGEQELNGFLKSSEQVLTDTKGNRSFDRGSRINIFV